MSDPYNLRNEPNEFESVDCLTIKKNTLRSEQ